MSSDVTIGVISVLSNISVVLGQLGEALTTFRCVTFSEQLNNPNAVMETVIGGITMCCNVPHQSLANAINISSSITCPFVVKLV